jgi:putative MATE family efflux protein
MRAPLRLTDGPITPALLRLAWPVFVGHLLHTAYGMADTIWVGRLGPAAIGAVSACFYASWSLMAIGDIFAAGVTALVSQAVGARQDREAGTAALTGVVAGAAIGAVIAVAGWFGSAPLFARLFEDAATARMAADYFSLYCLLAPVFYVAFVLESVYRSCGDSRTPMLVMLVGTVLNVSLDPFLILGLGPFPRLGVQGAAIATIVAELVVLGIFAALYLRGAVPLQIPLSEVAGRFSWRRAGQILRIGAPTALVGILFSVVYLFLANITERFGAPALAALGIGNRLESLNYLTAIAIGMGVATMVGQNLGAGRKDRAEAIAHRGAVLATIMTGTMTFAYLMWPEPIARLFTSDAEAIGHCVRFLRIVAISQVFMGWELVYGQAFTGAGDTLPPMYVSVITSILRVPLAWWLAVHTGAGPMAIWWIISLSGILRGILIVGWFQLGHWRRKDLGVGAPVPVPVAVPVPAHGPESPEG